MVGTAVHQLGRTSPSQPKNLNALKPGVQQTAAPAASEDEHRGDQPVDMEQRHDVEADIVRRQAQGESTI